MAIGVGTGTGGSYRHNQEEIRDQDDRHREYLARRRRKITRYNENSGQVSIGCVGRGGIRGIEKTVDIQEEILDMREAGLSQGWETLIPKKECKADADK